MISTFDEDGISFRFPTNWTLEREATDEGWTATVQSPGTAFWMLTLRTDHPEVRALAESGLDAMRQEYSDLESSPQIETLAGQPAIGHDIEFFALDLTNTCRIRSLSSAAGTVMVFWQLADIEWELNAPVLRAISASLRVEDE